MAGFIVHLGAGIQCPHGAQATIMAPSPRVQVMGNAVALLTDPTTIAGCPFQVPVGAGTKPQPCVTARWQVGSTRVKVMGQPVVLQTSTGICQSADQIPAGTPKVTSTQTRVIAT
jgi:hypothetical protein